MKTIFLIFFGGGIGSLCRYFLGKFIQSNIYTSLPIATLIINILASFILGLFVGKTISSNEEMRALIAIGFCGGFSTFSTFSNETLQLLLNGKTTDGVLYIFLSVTLCLSATYTGVLFGR